MMRLDRFLTVHVFRHLNRILPQPKGVRIPILMYHSICDERERGRQYKWMNTSPKRFDEHMRFLHDNNYKVIDLRAAVRLIGLSDDPMQSGPSTLNRDKLVVLSFDDGFKDFQTEAFPVLKKYGFTATVFLPTYYMDGKGPGLRGKDHLGWNDVRNLQAEGVLFGSHTMTHLDLRAMKAEEIKHELRESKSVIEVRTGTEVTSFSYPYRFPEQDRLFVRRLKSYLEDLGYENAVTTRVGIVNSRLETFCLKRIPINSGDDPVLFRSKLKGCYDWVYVPQVASKFAREFFIRSQGIDNI